MSHEPTIDRAHPLTGTQKLYRFPNGYGASVIDGDLFYTSGGTFELAVLAYEPGAADDAGAITYDTPITSDVLGYQTWPEIEAALDAIAALPERVTA